MLIPSRKPSDLEVRRLTLANAVGSSTLTVAVGDCITPGATGHSKFVSNALGTGPILGVVIGLVYAGKFVEKTSVTGVNSASSVTGSNNVGNDNETTGAWQVDFIPAYIPMTYVADVNAAVGTTTDSDGIGFFAVVTATPGILGESTFKLWNETTALTPSSTPKQFVSYGSPAHLNNTKKVVGRIYAPEAL